MRNFDTGAIRSQANGKVEYYGFRHPAVELSFGKYMLHHQKMENGQMRTSNNWWKGWPTDVSIQSLVRHVEDLQALHAGYRVFKQRNEQGEETHFIKDPKDIPPDWFEVTTEECLNAIKFNCNSYLLQII